MFTFWFTSFSPWGGGIALKYKIMMKKVKLKKDKSNTTKANDRHIAFTFLYWSVLVADDAQSVVYSWSEQRNRLAEKNQ
jgi:hypothetical protein